MPFELLIAAGGRRGQRFGFKQAEVALGRAADNDLVLDHESVSRTHARIRARGAGHVLVDGGSTNGTELNGARLRGSATLRDGDCIGVGAIALEFKAPRRTWWRTRTSRLACAAGAGLALAVAAGALAFARHQRGAPLPAANPCPQVIALDAATAGLSFGRGVVDFDCGRTLAFGFTAAPTEQARFRYTPRQIAFADELELKLNGTHLGWVPVSHAGEEPQTVELPARLLSPGGRNVISAVQGRAGKEWSISGVGVELSARTPPDLRLAREAYERGRRKLEERRVAPRNRYDAWRAFVQSRASLEELAPRPPLYAEVSALAAVAERDLAKDCARLLFSAQRYEKYAEDGKAQLAYREILLHFPGEDPSNCRRRARQGIASAAPAEEG